MTEHFPPLMFKFEGKKSQNKHKKTPNQNSKTPTRGEITHIKTSCYL